MNVDILRLTLRQLLRGRRPIVLAVLPLAPSLLVWAYYALGGLAYRPEVAAQVLERLFVPLVMALVSLVLGASALGDEREDGTVVYLAATPLRRRSIVLAKLTAAWLACLVVCLPGLVAAVVFSLGDQLTRGALAWALVALVVTTLCYTAAFVWLSLRTRRPVLVGFLYVVLWEVSIAGFAPSANRLSIAAYGRGLVARGLGDAPRYNVPNVPLAADVIVPLLFATVAALAAARRLRRMELP